MLAGKEPVREAEWAKAALLSIPGWGWELFARWGCAACWKCGGRLSRDWPADMFSAATVERQLVPLPQWQKLDKAAVTDAGACAEAHAYVEDSQVYNGSEVWRSGRAVCAGDGWLS